MRVKKEKNGFSAHLISGTNTVMFGLDASKQARRGLLGFAIKKLEGSKERWLKGFKTFEETTPVNHVIGTLYDSNIHPIQDFTWSDYLAEPDTTYTYKIYPVKGTPKSLDLKEPIEITISTEDPNKGVHGIYFNMGAIASQAFSRRFNSLGPDKHEKNDPNNEKVKWLSRGLLEATLNFIGKAKNSNYALRIAAYEFTYKPIMDAFMKAHQNGADVKVIYEAGKKGNKLSSTSSSNAKKIEEYGFNKDLLIKRTNRTAIPHNKFIILLKNNKPVSVLGGSTNFTPSGFLGQSNVVHIVRDKDIAETYLKYWKILEKDPKRDEARAKIKSLSPFPPENLEPNSITPFFSPRARSKMLNWYASKIENAKQTVLFTAAFGVNKKLAEKFAVNEKFLRFVLMEKKSKTKEVREMMRQDADVQIAMGEKLNTTIRKHKFEGWELDDWFQEEEHYRKRGMIFYVHTKYLMIDVLTDDPLIFTGSANFSPNSLLSNDENMLLIRGNTRVADIYLTEFMRLFRHFYFRDFMRRMIDQNISSDRKPGFLEVDSEKWLERHFTEWRFNSKRRELFKG